MGVQVRPLFPVLLFYRIETNIMDEIKKQLSEKLGLSEEISQQAVDMVLGFVKDKLPEGMQGIVDSAMNGEMPDTDGLLDKAKGLFGG